MPGRWQPAGAAHLRVHAGRGQRTTEEAPPCPANSRSGSSSRRSEVTRQAPRLLSDQYASWDPYAEFYMIVDSSSMSVEYFYGSKSSQKVFKRMKELGQNLAVSKAWVEPEDMWLYS